MRLAGNPMAEHLESLLDLADTAHITTIQTTSDSHGNITGVFCGSLRDTFKRAVAASGEFCSHQARGKYDAAIGEILPPLDKSLYQAQKALENIQMGVRDGGAVVVVSACSDGIGTDFFYRLADNWDRRNNCAGDGRQHFGSHKLSRVNAMSRRLKVGIYSELEPDVVRHVFYEPVDDIESFISRAGEECGSKKNNGDADRPRLRLAVVHDAGNTVLKA
jgi:nickel-dependent lactate racemase